MSAYATLSSAPMTYRGLHWDDGCDLGIKTGPVGAELFEQFAQAFGGPSDAKRGRDNAADCFLAGAVGSRTGEEDVVLGVADRGVDRVQMCLIDDRLRPAVSDGPCGLDRLRDAEGEIKSGDRPGYPLLAVGFVGLDPSDRGVAGSRVKGAW